MAVQLSIPFETLVSLVEQLPDDEKHALIERVQEHSAIPTLSVAEKNRQVEGHPI